MLMPPPAAPRARNGTEILVDTMVRDGCAAGRRVLGVGTAGGAAAAAAARAGASSVEVVAPNRRSAVRARLAALRGGAEVRVYRGPLRRGDLGAPGRRFDLVVCGPPARGDAGPDRICAQAADVLTTDGQILLVQPSRCGTQATVDALARSGFLPAVLARVTLPRGRGRWWRRPSEEFVVIGGVR